MHAWGVGAVLRRMVIGAVALSLCIPAVGAHADSATNTTSGNDVTAKLTIFYNQTLCGGYVKHQITSFKGTWTRNVNARDVTEAHFTVGSQNGTTCADGGDNQTTAGTNTRSETWDPIFGSDNQTYVQYYVTWPYRGDPGGLGYNSGGWMHTHVKNTSNGNYMGAFCTRVSVQAYGGGCH